MKKQEKVEVRCDGSVGGKAGRQKLMTDIIHFQEANSTTAITFDVYALGSSNQLFLVDDSKIVVTCIVSHTRRQYDKPGRNLVCSNHLIYLWYNSG